jgi:CHAT domain-containing protein
MLDTYLSVSLTPEARVPAAEVYEQVLAWKGAVFGHQLRLRQLRSDPNLREGFDEYLSVCTRLATQSLTVPTSADRAAWLKDIELLTEHKERLEADFSQRSIALREQKALARLRTAELKGQLPKGTALVDFLVYTHFSPPKEKKGEFKTELHLVAFVLPSQGEVRTVSLGPVEPLTEVVEGWRPRAGRAKVGSPELGEELRRLVWEPLVPHLGEARTVLVGPDGALGRFPLAALPGKDPGTYLGEEIRLAVIPVPQMLPQLLARERGKPSGRAQMLLMGNISFDAEPHPGDASKSKQAQQMTADGLSLRDSQRRAVRGDEVFHFRPLPGTEKELEALAALFHKRWGKEASVVQQELATEEVFRQEAPQPQYLHVATHGFFAPASVKSALRASSPWRHGLASPSGDGADRVPGVHPGLLSGLALAGANRASSPAVDISSMRDDGIMTATEIASLDLRRVELAVLSACETGLGEVAAGEGMIGLQRAFQVAGVKTVVASLWKVDDDATQRLMQRFYENLWVREMDKLDALRDAQRWLKGQDDGRYRDPFYWAAFVLSGDWR